SQNSNYGRGGLQNDRLRAEGEDYSGTNNANMSTPADGSQPRMQMYVFTAPNAATLTASPGGTMTVGTATFGPSTFNISGELVLATDAVAPVNDGCSAITNSVAGKIVLIDRG